MKKIFFYIILGVILIACVGFIIPTNNTSNKPDTPIVDTKPPVGSEDGSIQPSDPQPMGGIDVDLLTEAVNCTYEFRNTEDERVYYLNTEYSGSYTLTATANEGYTISSVVYKGETHALPFTFIFEHDINNPQKFYLTATEITAPEPEATEALVYTLSEDESYYIVGTGFDSIEEIESFNSSAVASGFDSTWTGGDLVIPSNYNGLPVLAVAPYAFNEVTNISSVYIADGVTHLGKALFRCTKDNADTTMISCRLPNSLTFFGADGVNNTSCIIFQSRTALEEVNIPNNVKYIGTHAFYNCSSLTSITIPDKVTSLGNNAFNQCSSLTNITIPDKVTSLGTYAFNQCSSLTEITIPDSVTTIGNSAFYKCSNLVTVSFGANSQLATIEDYVFSESGLTTITIPDSVTTIGNCAFYKCSNLVTVSFGANSHLATIEDHAFNGSGLTTITIPDSLTCVSSNTFSLCYSLTTVVFGSNISYIKDYAFAYDPVILYDFSNALEVPKLDSFSAFGTAAGCKYVVPDDLYDSWIIANVWVSLASNIVKVSEYVPA